MKVHSNLLIGKERIGGPKGFFFKVVKTGISDSLGVGDGDI